MLLGNSTNILKDLYENPSMDNVLKTLTNFNTEDENDDEDLKELKKLVQDLMKQDLELNGPMDVMAFGVKLMMETESERSQQMQNVTLKIAHRI